MNPTDTQELLAALNFAAHKHTIQRRKDIAKSPYINHPIAVANVLAQCGVSDIVTLQAAILHDTMEDTDTTADELRASFGSEVTDIVREVTDDTSLPKEVRKKIQIEHAPFLSDRAKLVKLADKLMNIHDVTYNPPASWSLRRRKKYFEWSDAVVAGVRGVNKELEARYDLGIHEGRKTLDTAANQKLPIITRLLHALKTIKRRAG